MGNIIQGSELGAYRTIAITLGVSKKENNQGIKSKYIVLSLKNKKCIASKTRRVIMFEEDIPGAFECLRNFCPEEKDARGGRLVDMAKFKADAEAVSEWGQLLEFPGGMVEEYTLSKGLCYQNDVDGNRVIDKNTGKPITKRVINVFTIVDLIKPGANGNPVNVYMDGFGLNEQGQRMEARFYREAVEDNSSPTTDDVAALTPGNDDLDF